MDLPKGKGSGNFVDKTGDVFWPWVAKKIMEYGGRNAAGKTLQQQGPAWTPPTKSKPGDWPTMGADIGVAPPHKEQRGRANVDADLVRFNDAAARKDKAYLQAVVEANRRGPQKFLGK